MTPKPRGQRHLSREQIESGLHRQKVGGAWDEIGPLQLSFLRESGLSASDRLLDVGCGALRGGVHFVRYLDDGRYFGMDVESSLLDAGRYELERAGLSDKRVNLLADGDFRFGRFEQSFDYALAVSLFTHLDLNTIAKCLRRLRPVLTGSLYATFFEAPNRVHLKPIKRERERENGGFETYYDRDPYHYSLDEMRMIASWSGMSCEYIGDWSHPRGQMMLRFRRGSDSPEGLVSSVLRRLRR